MLRAVIIDDEEDAINVLVHLVKQITSVDIRISGTAMNLEEGVQLIKKTQPDIVFLDVEMPGENGMEIYNEFENPSFRVIFVTAYQQYAIRALKNSASDYLLKPVEFIELWESIQKVSRGFIEEQQRRETEDRLNHLSTPDIEGRNLMLDVENGFIVENTRNIEYCFADQSYSYVVTNTGRKILITKSLKELQESLPETQFYRTHKSYLVNIYYIRKFVHAADNYVLLRSGTKIPVSVRTSAIITKDIKKLLSV